MNLGTASITRGSVQIIKSETITASLQNKSLMFISLVVVQLTMTPFIILVSIDFV